MTLSIIEAAKVHGVTKQALFVAIKNGKLKATKQDGFHWAIELEDLHAYRAGRYSRKNLKYDGELVFPPGEGLLSVAQAARMLNIVEHKLYYAIYKNRIKHTRKGCAYVLHLDDVKAYERNNLVHFAHAE